MDTKTCHAILVCGYIEVAGSFCHDLKKKKKKARQLLFSTESDAYFSAVAVQQLLQPQRCGFPSFLSVSLLYPADS